MPAKSLQPHLTPHDRRDWGLPGSSVHGILQAGALGGVPTSPRDGRCRPGMEGVSSQAPGLRAGSLPVAPPGGLPA